MAREQRRLAAIVAADVVGYSRLMGRDESGTVGRLRRVRTERLEPVLAQRGGRIVKLTGDGALIEFGSAVEALSAAIEFQQAMAEGEAERPESERLVFRVGVHLGDVIVEGDDLYGDGVNVAARLEAEAPAGGIVVSGAVYEATAGRLTAVFDDLGRLALKNIERPVQAYAVRWQSHDWPRALAVASPTLPAAPTPPDTPLPLPDKPSIAVLPFQNMSGDPEQEYFADGIVEDIITALSRTKALFVIARNSTFTYKGTSPDIRQVGRDLGVRYVLEGSIRKAAARIRITGQLIDARSGAHLWADRFDGALEDIFDLQDQVTSRVVSAIAPTVEQEEIERAQRKPTENLQAYDYYLRGIFCFYKATRQANEEGLHLFHKAGRLDPGFALSFAFAANSYAQRLGYGWVQDEAGEAVEAERLARRALELDQKHPRLLAVVGWVLFFVVGRRKEGIALLDRAIELDANLFMGWQWRSLASLRLGEKEAIRYAKRALHLSSLDPRGSTAQLGMAAAHLAAGNYGEAAAWAEKAIVQRPRHLATVLTFMASYAMVGRVDEARTACQTYLRLDPDARVSNIRGRIPAGPDEGGERFLEGLRVAGLPE